MAKTLTLKLTEHELRLLRDAVVWRREEVGRLGNLPWRMASERSNYMLEVGVLLQAIDDSLRSFGKV